MKAEIENNRERLIKRLSYYQSGKYDLNNTFGVYARKAGLFYTWYGVKSINIKESKNGNRYCSIILTEVHTDSYYIKNTDAKKAGIKSLAEVIEFINNNEFGRAYQRIDTERYGSDFVGWIMEANAEGITELNM